MGSGRRRPMARAAAERSGRFHPMNLTTAVTVPNPTTCSVANAKVSRSISRLRSAFRLARSSLVPNVSSLVSIRPKRSSTDMVTVVT